MINFKFTRNLRLLTPNHFAHVFRKPQQTKMSHITVLSRFNMLNHPRIGFAITKKNVNQAHDRNRIKRIIRESFRAYQHNLPAIDFVIISKRNITNLDNFSLTKLVDKLWRHHC